MITLPDVRPKNTQRAHSSHPRFFPGLEFTDEGLRLIKGPELKFEQCIQTVHYSSNYNTTIFESSPDYFVVGEKDNSTFRIIFRKSDAGPDGDFRGLDSTDSVSTSRPGAADSAESACRMAAGKASSSTAESQTRRSRQVVICTPEFILQVRIYYDQVFFRSEGRIFIYTPAATSEIEVRSVDMYLSHFLYILTQDRILVYGESLVEEIEFEVLRDGGRGRKKRPGLGMAGMHNLTSDASRAVSKILVLDGAIFLVRFNIVYKVVGQQCVFSHDCVRPVISACTDGSRVYLHTKDYVFSIHAYENTVWSVYTGVSCGTLHLSDDLLLLHNGRNGTLFLLPETLVCVHSELLDTEYTAVSCSGRCISYVGHSHILTHTNQRQAAAESGAEGAEGPSKTVYGKAGIFEAVFELAGEPGEKDLDQELQDIIDNRPGEDADSTSGEHEAGRSAARASEQARLLTSCRRPRDFDTESFYYDGEGDGFHSGGLDSSSEAGTPVERGTASGEGGGQYTVSGDDACAITGKMNPDTPDIHAYAVCSGSVVRTYFRGNKCSYRQSGFFVRNHAEWFEQEFRKQKQGAEVPVSSAVYEFIESQAGGKPAAASVSRKAPSTGSMGARKKRKTGGF